MASSFHPVKPPVSPVAVKMGTLPSKLNHWPSRVDLYSVDFQAAKLAAAGPAAPRQLNGCPMASLRVRYQTIEFDDVDIHIRTLRDRQQFADTDGVSEALGISSAMWPIFGVVWASGEVLAHLMSDYEIVGKRILEVGCGIGLASLVLNHRSADITATDHHPEADNFLQQNTMLNDDRRIPFIRTGWSDGDSGLGEFDLIIGSDLLYEREHVDLLAAFIDQHAKPHCVVIIVDPGRGHNARFSKRMESLGYSHTQTKPANPDYLAQAFKGQIHRYAS